MSRIASVGRRDARITVKLSASELERVRRAAYDDATTVSALMRRVLLESLTTNEEGPLRQQRALGNTNSEGTS